MQYDDIRERLEAAERKLAEHDKLLAGEKGDFGMALKVTIMWRIGAAIACAAGGGLGVLFTRYLQTIVKP